MNYRSLTLKARDKRVSMSENSSQHPECEREESRADRAVEGEVYGFKTVLTYDRRGIRGRLDRAEGKSATMERIKSSSTGREGIRASFLQTERVRIGKANWNLSLSLLISRDSRNNVRIRGVKLQNGKRFETHRAENLVISGNGGIQRDNDLEEWLSRDMKYR